MKEIRLMLGSLRFERSVVLSVGLGASMSCGIGGRCMSAIQNELFDVDQLTTK